MTACNWTTVVQVLAALFALLAAGFWGAAGWQAAAFMQTPFRAG